MPDSILLKQRIQKALRQILGLAGVSLVTSFLVLVYSAKHEPPVIPPSVTIEGGELTWADVDEMREYYRVRVTPISLPRDFLPFPELPKDYKLDRKLTSEQFAGYLRAKTSSAYERLSDYELTCKVLTEYPQYRDVVDTSDLRDYEALAEASGATASGRTLSSGKSYMLLRSQEQDPYAVYGGHIVRRADPYAACWHPISIPLPPGAKLVPIPPGATIAEPIDLSGGMIPKPGPGHLDKLKAAIDFMDGLAKVDYAALFVKSAVISIPASLALWLLFIFARFIIRPIA